MTLLDARINQTAFIVFTLTLPFLVPSALTHWRRGERLHAVLAGLAAFGCAAAAVVAAVMLALFHP